jgi:hypothetical protein
VPTVSERLARAQAADPDIFLPKLARQLEIASRDVGLFCGYHQTNSLTKVADLVSALAPIVGHDLELDSETIEAIEGLVALLRKDEDERTGEELAKSRDIDHVSEIPEPVLAGVDPLASGGRDMSGGSRRRRARLAYQRAKELPTDSRGTRE